MYAIRTTGTKRGGIRKTTRWAEHDGMAEESIEWLRSFCKDLYKSTNLTNVYH